MVLYKHISETSELNRIIIKKQCKNKTFYYNKLNFIHKIYLNNLLTLFELIFKDTSYVTSNKILGSE